MADRVIEKAAAEFHNTVKITQSPANINRSTKTTDRYYLEEWFKQLPALNDVLFGSETKDFSSIGDGNEEIEDIPCVGAALGDFAMASISVDTVDLTLTATVTAADVVTVVMGNFTGAGIDLGSATLSVQVVKAGNLGANGHVSRDFQVAGTNMTTALSTRTAAGGITLTTAGADEDQSILGPHLDTAQSAWAGTAWSTAASMEWECKIYTSAAIDNQKIWAGLKLTTDQVLATDADQAYFKFQTDLTNSEEFTDYTVLHFVYSVAGTDYISALPITVAVSTAYHLKIVLDSSRQASIWVNGTQYNVTQTAGSTGGTAVTAGKSKSAALTSLTTLNPVIGIEAGDGAAAALGVGFVAMNQLR